MVFCDELFEAPRVFGKLFYPLNFILAICLDFMSLSVLSQYELIWKLFLSDSLKLLLFLFKVDVCMYILVRLTE